MNILVLGAGAIGSLYAAKLAARNAVTVVARPDHVAAINRDGLRVTGLEDFVARVTATTRVDRLSPDTLVLLTTKVGDSETAVRPIAPLLGPDCVILCVQNGLYGEEIVKRVGGGRCLVLRAITQFGAIFREPGVVEYKVAGQTTIEDAPPSAAIAATLTASGLGGRVSDAIKVEMWRKLIFNCVINPITAILGTEVGGIADARIDPLKQAVIDECLRVADADGVRFDVDFLSTIARVFAASRNISSMRQDLLKGRRTEIDYMNGAVADLGARFGIDCPVNRALVAIVKALEAQDAARRGLESALH